MVPHGYLSEDEGVDGPHPGELEEKEANAYPPQQPQPQQRRKKKFIPKEPLILGPFIGEAVMHELAQASPVQFLNPAWKGKNPFEGCDVVVAGLVSSSSKSSTSVANEFSPDLVTVLIEVKLQSIFLSFFPVRWFKRINQLV